VGTRLEKLRREHQRVLGIALISSLVGGLIAYPLLITAKVAWDLPNSWWWVASVPWVGFGFPVAALWFLSRRDLEVARRLDDLD
jgi:hypothetical protein